MENWVLSYDRKPHHSIDSKYASNLNINKHYVHNGVRLQRI